jgi:mycofactocin precursor
LALLACLYSAHCDEYKPYPRREGVTMADAATAELTGETAVTGPADDVASDLADDVLVEEVSIDGMCGVY